MNWLNIQQANSQQVYSEQIQEIQIPIKKLLLRAISSTCKQVFYFE